MTLTAGNFASTHSPSDLPSSAELLGRIERRSLLSWGEHCTECLWPTCYADCPLYTPRDDLLCRRFTDGIQWHSPASGGQGPATMRLQFRRLGKLEATGLVRLASSRAAKARHRRRRTAEAIINALPLALRNRSRSAFERVDGRVANGLDDLRPDDVFLLIVSNEGRADLRCTLTIKPRDPGTTRLYQTGMLLPPGESRHAIPVADILRFVDLRRDVLVQFEPTGEANHAPLSFAFIDFARLASPTTAAVVVPNVDNFSSSTATAPTTVKTAKCVVWDLDNTLWRGTLIEDGIEALRLDPVAVATIIELDQRGILQSVASKNNPDEAKAAIAHFGLTEYLLFPQISWNPKSQAVGDIAAALNIGIDTFVFVDDQPFERAEVQAGQPAVTVLDAADIPDMRTMPRFNVPVTEESRRRRRMYLEEQQRQTAHTAASTDFYDFLRDCMITLDVRRIDRSSFARVQELAQRTNQLNYSGRRISDAELNVLLAGDGPAVGLVLSATDRFGDYGIIGFAVVDQTAWTVRDFFMSCRVQRKTVEHAFFALLQERAAKAGADAVHVTYQPTKRNMPARQALQEMNLVTASGLADAEGITDYLLSVAVRVPHSDIVSVVAAW